MPHRRRDDGSNYSGARSMTDSDSFRSSRAPAQPNRTDRYNTASCCIRQMYPSAEYSRCYCSRNLCSRYFGNDCSRSNSCSRCLYRKHFRSRYSHCNCSRSRSYRNCRCSNSCSSYRNYSCRSLCCVCLRLLHRSSTEARAGCFGSRSCRFCADWYWKKNNLCKPYRKTPFA